MNTPSPRPFNDALTMLWRNILHNVRLPSGVILVIGIPMIFMLLFVYVFGAALGASLTTPGTRGAYLAFITPAIVLMAATSATQMIAVWISMDLSEGIVARFRTMAIAPSSVLAGHVYGGTLLVIFSTAILLGFSFLLGYRSQADALQWVTLAGLLCLLSFALAWLSLGFGLAAKRPDTASNLPVLLMLILPMLSGGFVRIDTLPDWLQGFAKYQPFTPIINTIRGLLAGAPVASDITWAIGWCVIIGVFGYVWSMWSYRRRAAQP
jgi:ABC-2 type transport system permease protein